MRAAILGANDGIVSTASLIVGVASAAAQPKDIALAGLAGLVAGAMSMAAGEYVSVSSQSDTERADIARESKELSDDPVFEHAELTEIYVKRGLDEALANQVATQLMSKDALATHLRDELGISEISTARPGASRADLGSDFRSRSRAALARSFHLTTERINPGCLRCLIGFSCCPGCCRSAPWGR